MIEAGDDPSGTDVGELARQFAQPLEAYALGLCGNAHDAQDLVQQTFERALRLRPERRPRQNRRAWLFTVLRHLFVDAHRRQASGPRRVEVDLGGVPAVEREPPPPAWQELSKHDVREALALLDEPFAETFCLHALEGRSYADIARELGVPVNTVGTRILRARKKLRRVLSERLT
ncbi:MAG TPA: RNA polymerase sigma factor [Polyangia bacterium]